MLFRSLSEPLRVLWDSELPVYSPVVRGPAKTSKMGCLLGNSAICCPKEGGLIGLRRTFKASFGAQRTSGLKRAAVPTVCDANARDVQPLAVAKSRNVMFGEALHRHNLRRRSCGVANAGIAELAQAGGQALDIASLLEIRGVRDAGAFTIAIVGALGLVKLFRYLASRDLLERVSPGRPQGTSFILRLWNMGYPLMLPVSEVLVCGESALGACLPSLGGLQRPATL